MVTSGTHNVFKLSFFFFFFLEWTGLLCYTQEPAQQTSTSRWWEPVPVTSDNVAGLQTTPTSLKRPGTGRTLQMSLTAPPVDPLGHRKGRCFASCRGGRAPDHKRQQQLSFSVLTSILIKINPASNLFSCILIPNVHRYDSTSGLTQNANSAISAANC